MAIKKRWTSFASAGIVLAASGALFLSAAPATAAGPPLTGSGTGQITSIDITPIRDAGGNTIQARTLTGEVTGTLKGTIVQHVTGVIHRTGHVTFQGVLVFTGTVEDCGEGTVTLRLSGKGEAGIPITEASLRVIDQAANTLFATGQGTVNQEGLALTYQLQYVCLEDQQNPNATGVQGEFERFLQQMQR